jgi:hypothetical protein
MRKVDQTPIILRHGRDILIMQVYVDDIVFCGSSNSLVARFAEDMSREFEMSKMGELQFFPRAFVHQAKYTKDIVRKFMMEDSKAMATPVSMTTTLDEDGEGEHVDKKEYHRMIGSLLYLRPDIQFSYICALVFKRLQGLLICKQSSAFLGICITLPTSTFGTLRLLLWLFMVFQMLILPGVDWIGSPLLGLASF